MKMTLGSLGIAHCARLHIGGRILKLVLKDILAYGIDSFDSRLRSFRSL
jgi:hypothetical protein